MKSLISPNEKIYNAQGEEIGWRVADIVADDATFEVADPLFWATCPEDATTKIYYYKDGQFIEMPAPPDETPVETIG
jgi:hypothetical protein